MDSLFCELVDIVFTLADGTRLLCRTTLNQDILRQYGYQDFDFFVDFLTNRRIPDELFEFDFIIAKVDTVDLCPLDAMFQLGGKLHWISIR